MTIFDVLSGSFKKLKLLRTGLTRTTTGRKQRIMRPEVAKTRREAKKKIVARTLETIRRTK